jgi:hypothetical protein
MLPIPPFGEDGKILIRGTMEWEDREEARQIAGMRLLSFGTIKASLRTRGETARWRSIFH